MKLVKIVLLCLSINCEVLSSSPFQREQYTQRGFQAEERKLNMFDDLRDLGNNVFKTNNSFYITYAGASLLMSVIMNYYKNSAASVANRQMLHELRYSYENMFIERMEKRKQEAVEMKQTLDSTNQNLINCNLQDIFQKALYMLD